ncbi:unnamed protein product [Arctogadus glacialis]
MAYKEIYEVLQHNGVPDTRISLYYFMHKRHLASRPALAGGTNSLHSHEASARREAQCQARTATSMSRQAHCHEAQGQPRTRHRTMTQKAYQAQRAQCQPNAPRHHSSQGLRHAEGPIIVNAATPRHPPPPSQRALSTPKPNASHRTPRPTPSQWTSDTVQRPMIRPRTAPKFKASARRASQCPATTRNPPHPSQGLS